MRVSIHQMLVVHHCRMGGGVGSRGNVRFEESATNANAMAIVSLSRMNCAMYHSNSGFVYASVPECIVERGVQLH